MPLSVALLFGSYRTGSNGRRVVTYLQRALESRGHVVHVIDAREMGVTFLEGRYSDYPEGQAPGRLSEIATLLRASDAVMAVTGEYNHDVQPGLRNLLDHFHKKEFGRKAMGLVGYSTGPIGGFRALRAFQPVVSALGAVPVPSILGLASVNKVLDESGNWVGDVPAAHAAFLNEFEWLAFALTAART